tara:strand:+ start:186 stop:671 length:486 start_codon:yes stop_codon:yes gene_type:complete
MMSKKLTHFDENGRPSMVDVSAKPIMLRTARARGDFVAKKETIDAILIGDLPKGEALTVARIAGIQAAKQCDSIIPLCHTIPLEYVQVDFDRKGDTRLVINTKVIAKGRTGIEMEALTAVNAAALALWDMTKAIDANLLIDNIHLCEKIKEPISLEPSLQK